MFRVSRICGAYSGWLVYADSWPYITSSDPRDRVHGLLGLLAPDAPDAIAPDYSESMTADILYTQVARTIIEKMEHLGVKLEMAQFPKRIVGRVGDEVAKRLPSWVPGFSHYRTTIALATNDHPRFWVYSPTGKEATT